MWGCYLFSQISSFLRWTTDDFPRLLHELPKLLPPLQSPCYSVLLPMPHAANRVCFSAFQSRQVFGDQAVIPEPGAEVEYSTGYSEEVFFLKGLLRAVG